MTPVLPLRDRPSLLKIVHEAAVEAGLAPLPHAQPAVLQVLLIGAYRMRQLNHQYLGHDWVTDVLAFDLRPSEPLLLPDPNPPSLIGAIFVCPQVAREQCSEYNTSVGYELILYIVHGMLHLAGELDKTVLQKQSMRQRENEIMNKLESRYTLNSVFR